MDFEVQGLVEHKEYLFRVAAANANGTGDWLEMPSPIVAKMPFGKLCALILHTYFHDNMHLDGFKVSHFKIGKGKINGWVLVIALPSSDS